MFWWQADDGPVRSALTGRPGGSSAGPHAGMNLGDHVGDDPRAVHRNRSEVARALDVPDDHLLFMRQVHGTHVAVADGPWVDGPPEVDALVTATPGVALAVLVADCVPVLLRDPRAGVVAVAHAGRRGMTDGVVAATVAAMAALGARRVDAVVGPSVCARCYEVPADLRDRAAATEPVSASVTWDATPSIDVAAGVLAQLDRAGVRARQLPGCTVERPDLYSYRRDGVTGRFAGVVLLR